MILPRLVGAVESESWSRNRWSRMNLGSEESDSESEKEKVEESESETESVILPRLVQP